MNYIHSDKDQARALADQLATLAIGLGAAKDNVKKMPGRPRQKRASSK
jgi:hypothetical protein